jgi:hypothetical protein
MLRVPSGIGGVAGAVPTVKGQCIDCHDAHSSDQKMLLRVVALSSRSK